MKTEKKFAYSIFAQRCPKNASVSQIADAACVIWHDINTALSPVIGQHGVVALIKRSLHLQCIHYPTLKVIHGSKVFPEKFSALHALLIKETSTNAVLVNSALLDTFYELLINLVGASLTHQLLHSVFAPPSNGAPAQDTSS